jgi:hypothetical protein
MELLMSNEKNKQVFHSVIGTVFIIMLVVFVLSACTTAVPVTAKFPDVPDRLKVQCPQLQKLDDSAKLSDVASTVTINYGTYYECAVKNDGWIEWYEIQKRIFEGAGK